MAKKPKHSDDVWRLTNANNVADTKRAYRDKDGLSKADRKRIEEIKWKMNHKTEEDIF